MKHVKSQELRRSLNAKMISLDEIQLDKVLVAVSEFQFKPIKIRIFITTKKLLVF